MVAVRTQYRAADIAGKDLRSLREAIEAAVPTSKGQYNDALTASASARVAQLEAHAAKDHLDLDRRAANWRLQRRAPTSFGRTSAN